MSDISQIPVEHTALYKFALMLYREHQATRFHAYTDAMEAKLEEVISHLGLDVQQIENQIVVTYVLDKGAVDGNPS